MSEYSVNDSHLPFWEAGSGHYGDTLGQFGRYVVEQCQDLVTSFLATDTEVEKQDTYTVADYGTNDGHASMSLIESIIRHVREKRGDLPVQVIYEDQEKNDFNSLFNRLAGTNYLSRHSRVFPFATNVNFYKQCVPDGACDVIFTSCTTHWLESLDDVTFKDCVFCTSLSPIKDVDVITRLRQIAARDWTKFLLLRARELKSGGLLVVLSLSAFNGHRACDSKKEATLPQNGNSLHCGAVLRDQVGGNDVRRDLELAWRKLRDDRKITLQEFESCTAPCVFRTAREITAPFEEINSPVVEAGLKMEYHDQVVYPFHAKLMWRNKCSSVPNKNAEKIEDRKLFGQMMTAAHRVWSETTFRNSLSSTRTAEDKAAILDELYTSFEDNVSAASVDDYNTDYIVSRLVVRKL